MQIDDIINIINNYKNFFMNRNVYFTKGEDVYDGAFEESNISIADIPTECHLVNITRLTDHEFNIIKEIIPGSSTLYDTPPWNSESLISPNFQLKILEKSGITADTDYHEDFVITPQLFNTEAENNELIKNLYYMAMDEYKDFRTFENLVNENLMALSDFFDGLKDDNELSIDAKTKNRTINYMTAPVTLYKELLASNQISSKTAFREIMKETAERFEQFEEKFNEDMNIDIQLGKKFAKACLKKVRQFITLDFESKLDIS